MRSLPAGHRAVGARFPVGLREIGATVSSRYRFPGPVLHQIDYQRTTACAAAEDRLVGLEGRDRGRRRRCQYPQLQGVIAARREVRMRQSSQAVVPRIAPQSGRCAGGEGVGCSMRGDAVFTVALRGCDDPPLRIQRCGGLGVSPARSASSSLALIQHRC